MSADDTNSDFVREDLLALSRKCDGPILGIDTSVGAASLCLVGWQADQVKEIGIQTDRQPSEALSQGLAQQAKEHKFEWSRLRGIVVGLGPGSFTGLRVGLATAKGLALGCGCNIFGTSSFALTAATYGPGIVAVVYDARRGDCFLAAYDVDAHGQVSELVADQVVPEGQIGPMLQEFELDALVGDRAERFAPNVASSVQIHAQAQPRASFGILHATARLVSGNADDLQKLAPKYLRQSEAERQADKAARQ